jgi:two-component system LytT family response regulator
VLVYSLIATAARAANRGATDLAPLPLTAGPVSKVAVQLGRNRYSVDIASIHWIEADGYCVRLHEGSGSHLVRQTMRHFEATIDPRCFIRVHRSAIVNLRFIAGLKHADGGSHTLTLLDGTELPVSRARFRAISDRLSHS